MGSASSRKTERIEDAHVSFDDCDASLRKFCRDLRFKSETTLLDLDRLKNLASDRLVTRFHICQATAGHLIAERGENPIANTMHP